MLHRSLAAGFAVVALVVAVGCSGGTTGVGGDLFGDGGSEGGGRGDGGGGGGDGGGGGGGPRVKTGSCGGSLTGGELGPTVSFELTAKGRYCTGSPSTCDATWLTILDGQGNAIIYGNTCSSDCDACELVGCPANCPQPSPLPAAGVRQTWDGRLYTSGASCKSKEGDSLTCLSLNCAPAGQYIARMCAYETGGDSASCNGLTSGQTPKCTDVPFTWPTSGTVKGSVD